MIMGLVAKAVNRSLHLACRRRRNFIIDQTNVSKDARRRKLSQFKDFQVWSTLTEHWWEMINHWLTLFSCLSSRKTRAGGEFLIGELTLSPLCHQKSSNKRTILVDRSKEKRFTPLECMEEVEMVNSNKVPATIHVLSIFLITDCFLYL